MTTTNIENIVKHESKIDYENIAAKQRGGVFKMISNRHHDHRANNQQKYTKL